MVCCPHTHPAVVTAARVVVLQPTGTAAGRELLMAQLQHDESLRQMNVQLDESWTKIVEVRKTLDCRSQIMI